MTDLALSVQCVCLRCGLERTLPKRDQIVRSVGEAPVMYVDTKTKCPRCPCRTLRVTLVQSHQDD